MRLADNVMEHLDKVLPLPDGAMHNVEFLAFEGKEILVKTTDGRYYMAGEVVPRDAAGAMGGKYSVGALCASDLLQRAGVTTEEERKDFRLWWMEGEAKCGYARRMADLRRLAQELEMDTVVAEIDRLQKAKP